MLFHRLVQTFLNVTLYQPILCLQPRPSGKDSWMTLLRTNKLSGCKTRRTCDDGVADATPHDP